MARNSPSRRLRTDYNHRERSALYNATSDDQLSHSPPLTEQVIVEAEALGVWGMTPIERLGGGYFEDLDDGQLGEINRGLGFCSRRPIYDETDPELVIPDFDPASLN